MTAQEALLTGYLLGLLMREEGGLVRKVLPQLDEAGNYQPWLRVRCGDAVLRIDVCEEMAPAEPARSITEPAPKNPNENHD